MSDLPNSFQVQNRYSDGILHLLSGEEWKVLSYAIRKTLGLKRAEERISLSQFSHGTFEEGKFLDFGTGLGVGTVEKAIALFKQIGVLIETKPAIPAIHKAPCYRVQDDLSQVDIEFLKDRAVKKYNSNSSRTEKARKARKKGQDSAPPPTVGQEAKAGTVAQQANEPPIVGQSDRVLSDNGAAYCATENPPTVAQEAIKEDRVIDSLRQGIDNGKSPNGDGEKRRGPSDELLALYKNRDELIAYLKSKLNGRAIPDLKAQKACALWLLQQGGYTVDECKECLDYQMESSWREKADWKTVKQDIAQFFAKRERVPRAKESEGERRISEIVGRWQEEDGGKNHLGSEAGRVSDGSGRSRNGSDGGSLDGRSFRSTNGVALRLLSGRS